MDHNTDKIHVMPLGDQWEVEAQSGQALVHEDKKEAALETAKVLARQQHIETVILHDGDGVTEEVHVPPLENSPSVKNMNTKINVGYMDRIASITGGTALLGYGLIRRSGLSSILGLLGAVLLYRGISGKCELYKHLGVDTTVAPHRGVSGNKGLRLEKTVEIIRSPAQVYSYWRNLENLPKFMPHLKSVEETGPGRSHWTVKGPAGTSVEWDAEILNEHPGEMIAWQSLPGSQIENAGSVRFESLADGQQTRVIVIMQYYPPAGVLGKTISAALGESPQRQLEKDLARFKELLETDTDGAEIAA